MTNSTRTEPQWTNRCFTPTSKGPLGAPRAASIPTHTYTHIVVAPELTKSGNVIGLLTTGAELMAPTSVMAPPAALQGMAFRTQTASNEQ